MSIGRPGDSRRSGGLELETTRRPVGVEERRLVTPVGIRSGRWGTLLFEVMLIAVAALLYSLVRGITDDRVGAAFDNAARVVSFERGVGLYVEPDLQAAVIDSDFVVKAANALYMAYWPIMIGTLVWLLVWHPHRYRLFRNAVLVSGAFSLAVFAVYPLAPPRFVDGLGIVDTIAAHSPGYRDMNASALVNEYAAMPSLHVGWTLLVAIAVISLTRSPVVRIAAATLPVLMLIATVLTANHYIVDGLAGSAIVVAGLAIAMALRRRADNEHPARAVVKDGRWVEGSDGRE